MAIEARDDILLTLTSSLDFIEALGTQIAQDRLLLVPMLSMVRSVFDTVMWVAHMLDPENSTELRLARVADHRLATASETIAANETLGQDNTEFEQNRAELVAWCARLGIEEKFSRRGERLAVVLGDAKQDVRWSTTKVVERAAPRATYLWKHGSGATHNEYWFTAAQSGSDEQKLIIVVDGLLATSDVLADVLAAYLGIDVAPVHEATHLRRRRLHAGPDGDPGKETCLSVSE